MTVIQQWLENGLWWWLIAGSAFIFVATLVLIPWLVIRLPADYFDHRRRESAKPSEIKNRFVYWLILAVKNLAGAVFLIIGISMLVLPGQGLLTILIGLSLIDFPGKYRLERYLVTRRPVLAGLNWLRRQGGKPPFKFSDVSSAPAIS